MKKVLLSVAIFLLFLPISSLAAGKFEAARKEMVEYQIKHRGVSDKKLLNALLEVPRHLFVPPSFQAEAYRDYPLPIAGGQTISQPYIVAFMTELLELKPEKRILEIGTGSGYQAAVLAELVKEVYSIEIIPGLAQSAQKLLKKLGYKNIVIKTGDGYRGWPDKAPFDGIMVTAAPGHIPEPLIKQLKIGGIMVIPVGEGFQYLTVIKRTKTGIIKKRVLPVRFVPMTGEAQGKR